MLSFLVVHCQSSSNNGGQLVTDKYYGTPLGPLSPGAATGHVYASDENTIFIKGFNFDGTRNPYSYFQAGSTLLPDGTGFTVADDKGTYVMIDNFFSVLLIVIDFLKLIFFFNLVTINWAIIRIKI